jgi:hypothetical protein
MARKNSKEAKLLSWEQSKEPRKSDEYSVWACCRTNCLDRFLVSIKKGVTVEQALQESPIQCPNCEAARLEA